MLGVHSQMGIREPEKIKKNQSRMDDTEVI